MASCCPFTGSSWSRKPHLDRWVLRGAAVRCSTSEGLIESNQRLGYGASCSAVVFKTRSVCRMPSRLRAGNLTASRPRAAKFLYRL